jgi:hypothetical protein
MKIGYRTIAFRLLILLVLMMSPRSWAFWQSQSGPPARSQAPSQTQAQTKAQAQMDSQASADVTPKEGSVAEASRKAKAKKENTARGKVFTDDDLSGLRGNGVSVVGDGYSGASASRRNDSPTAAPGGAIESGVHDEPYWRAKSRDLLDQIAATEQEIAKTQDEIKKYGNIGFDPATHLNQNVILVDDRPTKLKKLEERKQDLQKQLENLEDEGRKEGAPPSWFR